MNSGVQSLMIGEDSRARTTLLVLQCTDHIIIASHRNVSQPAGQASSGSPMIHQRGQQRLKGYERKNFIIIQITFHSSVIHPRYQFLCQGK